MTSKFSTLSSATKTIIVAAILGATLLASSGAQAASNNFQGSFRIDLGNGVTFGINNNSNRGYNRNRGSRHACLNTRQVIGGLQRMGHRNIRVIGGKGRFVKVKSIRHRNRHIVRVNKCSGKVAVLSTRRIQHKNKNNNRGGRRVTLHY